MNIKNFFKRNKPELRQNCGCNSAPAPALHSGNLFNFKSISGLNLSAVYRCTDLVSSGVAQLPILLYKVDGKSKTLYRESPAFDMLKRFPNQSTTRFQFMKSVMLDTLLQGNSYAYIKRDTKGNAIELHYIPACNVTVLYDQTNFIDRNLRYLVAGYTKEFSPDEILHFKLYSRDGIMGHSVLSHARQTLMIGNAAMQNVSDAFSSGGLINGYISSDMSLDDDMKNEVLNSWGEQVEGNKARIPVLERGMKFNPVNVPPADLQMLEQQQFNVVEIGRFFGVHPIMLYDLTKNSYASAEAANLEFLSGTLSPYLESIENELILKLFTKFERKSILINFDETSILRTDTTAKANYIKTLIDKGMISINEARKMAGLETISNPEFDKHFQQINIGEVGQTPNTQLNG